MVFDRTAEVDEFGNQVEDPPNVYFHPCRSGVTERVTQLRDGQQQALVDFLLAKHDSSTSVTGKTASTCPLPILVDKKNTVRVNPELAITLRGIFRDLWERVPLTEDEMDRLVRRPQQAIDYPEAQELSISINQRLAIPMPEKMRKRLEEEERESADTPES